MITMMTTVTKDIYIYIYSGRYTEQTSDWLYTRTKRTNKMMMIMMSVNDEWGMRRKKQKEGGGKQQ